MCEWSNVSLGFFFFFSNIISRKLLTDMEYGHRNCQCCTFVYFYYYSFYYEYVLASYVKRLLCPHLYRALTPSQHLGSNSCSWQVVCVQSWWRTTAGPEWMVGAPTLPKLLDIVSQLSDYIFTLTHIKKLHQLFYVYRIHMKITVTV